MSNPKKAAFSTGKRTVLKSLRVLFPRFLRRPIRAGVEQLTDAGALADALRSRLLRRVRPASAPNRRVLIVDELVPDPLYGAGFPRAWAIVHALIRAGYRIDFYPMWSSPTDPARMTALLDGHARFHVGTGMRGLRRLLWREGATFGMIIVSRPGPMRAFIATRWMPPVPRAPLIVYDAEAVVTPREVLQRALFDSAWSAEDDERALSTELALTKAADAITVVTPTDGALIATATDAPILVLSHPVSLRLSTTAFADRHDLLFVGPLTGPARTSPNVDSMLWFTTQVMPLLDQRIGTAYRLHIVGILDSPELEALGSDRILLHGPVKRLDSFYDNCRVFVAPTRYAAGLPLKIIETMGKGLPCVATPLLARQVGVEGHGFAVDASTTTFADRCALLYTNSQSWYAARDHGIHHVSQYFSPEVFDRTIAELIGHASFAQAARSNQ